MLGTKSEFIVKKKKKAGKDLKTYTNPLLSPEINHNYVIPSSYLSTLLLTIPKFGDFNLLRHSVLVIVYPDIRVFFLIMSSLNLAC